MEFAKRFNFDENVILAIGHIIISHHGKKEYGSPVLPSTPEALIVSAADELDFLVYCWDSTPPADELSLSEYNGWRSAVFGNHKPASILTNWR